MFFFLNFLFRLCIIFYWQICSNRYRDIWTIPSMWTTWVSSNLSWYQKNRPRGYVYHFTIYVFNYKQKWIIKNEISILISLYIPVWIVVAGICAIGTVLALSAFVLFSILHVSMQLQRREIWISFKRNIFMKLIMSAIAGTY